VRFLTPVGEVPLVQIVGRGSAGASGLQVNEYWGGGGVLPRGQVAGA
jgi:hypothetical protein